MSNFFLVVATTSLYIGILMCIVELSLQSPKYKIVYEHKTSVTFAMLEGCHVNVANCNFVIPIVS